ncbi:diguanylate phosphodiesterase [Vibrio navarrensis]|uniref:Diguanylate phosphodiesterase n=1 Tax=Vibrio navarrensis TaxID=29495 RepID=A0A099MFX8_9VIBR|nr:EAL domain-containing protein [Vibrio navarrensis]KGK11934.1 diguanylate phosphodiesterase [Vibrio navarrensis]KGK19318.1 diguanylate phosphodiesterase [Vibrio navarrensis]MBE4581287.1 diguanylate phosphodiesterase [Vibrio navarrensis]MBE4586128.1 diguanylate phosphodiesterase [Vibrio navarrensis]MBE4607737.1 diguanylate phosphodiesterase [Vibrio navarrensis]
MNTLTAERLDEYIYTSSDGQFFARYKEMTLRSVFQPIYKKDMTLVGLEALVRIDCADGSTIRPDLFFHSDDVSPTDRLNVERLSRIIHIRNFALSRYRDKHLFLNVLPHAIERLANEELSYNFLLRTIQEANLRPSQIVMELIEVHVNCEQELQFATRSLSRNGFMWAIDDFGVEASTHERTRNILPNIIKLDRSLLQRYEQGETALLLAALEFAGEMNSMTVIEGIETEHQLALMKLLNLDMYQGYLLAMPKSLSEEHLFSTACYA